MSFFDVLARGDDCIRDMDGRTSYLKNMVSHLTCGLVVAGSKAIVKTLYNVDVKGLDNVENALTDARQQNRGFITYMNHMSVCDDPFIWACLPWRFYRHLDDIRWGVAASNVCFTNIVCQRFFSLGKILPCDRFGRGPFQAGLDACVRILSPDETLDASHFFLPDETKAANTTIQSCIPAGFPSRDNFLSEKYISPVLRNKTSWVHIFPEGFVCQLQPPFNNSMRFFHWGIARLILEPTVAPVVVPIYSNGFEKIKPEKVQDSFWDFFKFDNWGTTVKVNFGQRIDDEVIEAWRDEWKQLCNKYPDEQNPAKMSEELMFGDEAKALRSKVAGYLREVSSKLREENGLGKEDPRFKDVKWWEDYTRSEGRSDPEVKFVGLNWANQKYQSNVKVYDQYGHLISEEKNKPPTTSTKEGP